MFSKKLIVQATLLMVVVLVALSTATSAKADDPIQFANCVDGVCTFPLIRVWSPNGDCEFNINHTLDKIGGGKNFWFIPNGNGTDLSNDVNFNRSAGSMDSKSGYRDITLATDGLVPGRCACDVASMIYVTGLANGYKALPDKVDHYTFPGVPDKKYSVAIWNPGKNMYMPNDTGEDIFFRWKIESGAVVMWMERGGKAKFDFPPAPEFPTFATPTPAPSSASDLGVVKVKTTVGGVIPIETTVDLKEVFGLNTVAGQILAGFVIFIILLVATGFWWLNNKNKVLSERLGESDVYKKSTLLKIYWWVGVFFILLSSWYDEPLLWNMTWVLWQVWFVLKVWDWGKRLIFHQNANGHIPWFLSLAKELVLTVVIGWYVFYMIGFSLGFIPSVWDYLTDGAKATQPDGGGSDTFIPLDGTDWKLPLQDIPKSFTQKVMDMRNDLVLIGKEEDVPPETAPTLWLKESGGRETNPANGEGLCGFHDLAVSGTMSFPANKALSKADILAQLRLCAKEFKKRSSGITFETTDLTKLGPVYMRYNGNIDCSGNPFKDYTFHPYVMNGWDESHTGMMARDGKGGCVSLVIIGALPAHVRIGAILRSPRIVPEEPPTTPPTLPPFDPKDVKPCSDPLGFCGFALKGGPDNYIEGTVANGGKGIHCNLKNECGLDWWDATKATSAVKPIDVLSMLNGTVSAMGTYGNGTPYIEITNTSGRKQAVYHCDKNYVTVNDVVTWGQPVCLMGNIGESAWTHLHLVLLNTDGSSITDQTQWWPK